MNFVIKSLTVVRVHKALMWKVW